MGNEITDISKTLVHVDTDVTRASKNHQAIARAMQHPTLNGYELMKVNRTYPFLSEKNAFDLFTGQNGSQYHRFIVNGDSKRSTDLLLDMLLHAEDIGYHPGSIIVFGNSSQFKEFTDLGAKIIEPCGGGVVDVENIKKVDLVRAYLLPQ